MSTNAWGPCQGTTTIAPKNSCRVLIRKCKNIGRIRKANLYNPILCDEHWNNLKDKKNTRVFNANS